MCLKNVATIGRPPLECVPRDLNHLRDVASRAHRKQRPLQLHLSRTWRRSVITRLAVLIHAVVDERLSRLYHGEHALQQLWHLITADLESDPSTHRDDGQKFG